jgi:ABC-2 type transport system permease protein
MIQKFREILQYRELLQTLVAKDLKIRYHGTIFGYLWSLLNPFLMMLVYTLVFAVFLRIKMEHYSLFLIAALLPWTFFSNSLLTGTVSIVGNAHFIQKFYCPRELFPAAILASNAIILLLSFIPFLLFLVYMKGTLGWSLLLLPVVVVIHLAFTLGLALLLSGLFVFFRDVRHLLEFFMMIWFYLTPVIYPLDMVPEKYRFFFLLNPMVPILTLYRNVLYDLAFPAATTFLTALAVACVSLFVGWKAFLSMEKSFVKEL